MEREKNEDKAKSETQDKFPGYPKYPAKEDIYKQDEEKEFIEDESLKDSDEEEAPGYDLDIPGAELDDADEEIGEEDEENNYYSLDDDQENEDTD